MFTGDYTYRRLARLGAAGAIAGFLGFLILEPWSGDEAAATLAQVFIDAVWAFAVIGAVVSLALVAAEEIDSGALKRIGSRGLKGLLVGGIGGCFAGFLGQLFFTIAAPSASDASLIGVLALIQLVFARTVGWAIVGAVIGGATGAAAGSNRKAFLGMIGGAVGGGFGGLLFDVIGLPFQQGTVSRLIGFTVVGLATGLAIALVEEIAKRAWITILSGPREGKDYILTKPITTIGRDELADIPLFGDLNVGRLHATVTQTGGAHLYRDQGGGTQVNNQPAQSKTLIDGDVIRVGRFTMRFRTRGSPRSVQPVVQPAQDRGPAAPGVCPFCGQAYDCAGGCACSVSGGAPAATPPQGAVPRLRIVSGPEAGKTFDILQYSVTIGRSPSSVIALEQDPMVSRNHATLSYENGSYIVRDAGSSNGTYVNGARVSESPLMPGDTLVVGGTSMTFVFE